MGRKIVVINRTKEFQSTVMESVSGLEILPTKFYFSRTYFLAISLLVASLPAQSFGELIVLHHPTIDNGKSRNLTCVSEDDDAALIWNYNSDLVGINSTQNRFTNFEPKKPPSNIPTNCAIWNPTRCLAVWKNTEAWNVVNSAVKPMGPVLDYRWEGFKEFVFTQDNRTKRYQHVKQVEKTTETVVVSVRGFRAVSILLCEKEKPANGLCHKITLGGSRGTKSEMYTCYPKEFKIGSSTNGNNCTTVANVTHGSKDALDTYAWRTFTLNWNSGNKVVQIFRDTDPEDEPFLRGEVATLQDVSHILVDSEFLARVRFHFYDYYMTEKKKSVLYSEELNHDGDNFCVELQVGLCPECKLRVDVGDNSSRPPTFEHVRNISGREKFVHNKLLKWRSVKLNTKVAFKKFSLRVKTIFNGEGSGQWAINNFRMCQPAGSVRESTIMTHRDKPANLWPIVRCQKLSNAKTDVVDASSTGTITDTSQLQQLIGNWSISCGPSCPKLGKNSSICNPTGCTCDRGFHEDCNQECSQGYHGFNCTEECGSSCKNGSCNATTGDCSEGCTRNELLPPLCKEEKPLTEGITDIQGPRAIFTSDTEVTLQWKPAQSRSEKKVGYIVSIKMDELMGCTDLRRTTPVHEEILKNVTEEKVSVNGLHPYARYTATVTAYTTIREMSKTVTFQTLATDIPTSKVSQFRVGKNGARLEWDDPADCTTITGPTKWKRLLFTGVGESVKNYTVAKETELKYFEPNMLGKLIPYTRYRVRIHVIRNEMGTENSTCYQELEWRTPPTKPGRVKNLTIYEADPDTNTFSLRWREPRPAKGEIEAYYVTIEGSQIFRSNKTLSVSKEELICKEKRNYVCFRNLTLPPNVMKINPNITVYAMNVNVTESGTPNIVVFIPKLHFKVPSQPRNLTASPGDHGIVKLEWAHPSVSFTKIVRFEIRVEVLEKKLSDDIETPRFPIVETYNVSTKMDNYSRKLYLPTSTSYRISVMAMNEKNLYSSRAQVNTTVGDGVAFDGTLNITRNGNLITLEVPGVANRTRETMVSVVVKGVLKCNEKPVSSLVVYTYEPKNREPKQITINANDLHDNASNCSLDIGQGWEFEVVAKNSKAATLANLVQSQMSVAENRPQNPVWLIVLLIIAFVCAILLGIYIWHRRRRRVPAQESYTEIIQLSQRKPSMIRSTENLTNSYDRLSSTPPPVIYENGDRLSNNVYAVPFVLESNSVNTTCFEEYAKESAFNEVLTSQYGLFPRGLVRPCDYGRLPQNMPKNRSKNLIAYDESRVILDKLPGDPYSDYINANYIQGYGEASAYIATQGPKPNTVNDFWRMIKQKKVLVICMLTNIVENGMKMCEKYWPDVKTEETYGEITVSTTYEEVFADYTLRTFKLNYKDEDTRTVTHLHYTGWPDDGVPMYPQSLVSYLQKLVEILDGHGPVVIHCSAGDGRTGTVILCDMCVRQGIAEGKIEVSDVTKRMHNSRANMIDTPQQYVFAHVIIAESLMSIPTRIPCNDDLPSRLTSLKKQLPVHVQRVNNSVWQERALHSLGSQQRRVSSSMPRRELPELVQASVEVDIYERSSDFDRETNYINAVPVDGLRTKNQYLSSQLPSPSGLPDFWRFIAERHIELVVILQRPDTRDPMFCDVMPGESILVPVSYIQVETERHLDEGELFTIDKLLLTDTSEEKPRPQPVSVITCNGWGCGRTGKLPATNALVSLWRAAENAKPKEGPTLVLCQDGVTACGLYLALSFLLERMTVERECDVISAVRAVRRSRPEFVQSMEQFEYLYDAAMNYSECFQTYANFSQFVTEFL